MRVQQRGTIQVYFIQWYSGLYCSLFPEEIMHHQIGCMRYVADQDIYLLEQQSISDLADEVWYYIGSADVMYLLDGVDRE